MKLNTKLGMLAAAGAMAVVAPAAAHPGGNPHGQPSGSHKCQPHNRAYVEAGTVDSSTASTLAQNSDGTWSGTLVVDVTRANHAARADEGQTVTYTFDSATVRVAFDGGATGLAAGERIKLIGKLATVAKMCPAPTTAPVPAFKRVVVHPAASSGSESSGSDSSG
ncbi:MAG TPA: hypothetical protein VGF70_10365 [Solirubrobacteraceae bacterium]|jgi:hypothetical protein